MFCVYMVLIGFPNATIEWKWNDRPIRELNDPNLQIEGNGPRSDLLIIPRERRYYTAYKCVAKNRLGTAEHIMELREARIPDVIPQAKPVVVTATSITFEILSPPYDPGLPITAFAAQYKDRNEPDWTNAYNRSWSPESKFTVEGLRPQTFYDFRFAALNKVGLGQWGAYVAQATPVRSFPESPKILHNKVQNSDNKDEEPLVVSPYSDHFELSWSIPPGNSKWILYLNLVLGFYLMKTNDKLCSNILILLIFRFKSFQIMVNQSISIRSNTAPVSNRSKTIKYDLNRSSCSRKIFNLIRYIFTFVFKTII